MYRRRRLAVVLLAFLVVAALAVGAIALAGVLGRGADAAGGTPAPATASAVPSPTSTATPPSGPPSSPPSSAAPTPTASRTSPAPTPRATTARPSAGAAAAACAADVTVAAETDEQAYGPDEDPVLSLVVRNEGTEPCTVNVGTSQMEFVLTRADERVFSSIDCQQSSQDLQRTIAPGGEERATFEWSRNRSVPGCTAVDDQPAAGGYSLTTRLGARSSAPAEFTLQ